MAPWMESFYHIMESPDNLYSYDIEPLSVDEEMIKFISQIEDLKLGKVVPQSQMIISYPPKPYVIHNIKRMSETGFDKFDLLNYISSFTIYLGGGGTQNSWFLQTDYPFYSSTELIFPKIASLFDRLNTNETRNITIVVSKRNDDRIRDIASRYNTRHLSFLFNFDSFRNNKNSIEMIKNFNHDIVLAILPNEIEAIEEDLKFIKAKDCSLRFLINKSNAMEVAEKLANDNYLSKCNYFPIWDNNYDFFYENVLLTEEDILNEKRTRRSIHCHQLLNINYWGKLNLLPNGKIYADLNEPPIGSIDDALYGIVEKELLNGFSWRRIRNNEKCRNCLYQWLCPSPSAFETLSGRTACKGIIE